MRSLLPLLLMSASVSIASAATAPPATLDGGNRTGTLVVTHGGVGSPPALKDGTQAAADSAARMLTHGASSLDAAIAAAVVMENDGRFNAGIGANIRLDGKTQQMDAALMTSSGKFAAVAAIERVRNPILVARAVMDSTPHLMLAGQGAINFARLVGFEDVSAPSAEAKKKFRARMRRQAEVFGRTDTTFFDWRRYWNFPGPMPADVLEWRKYGDTVGSVARDANGTFSATLTTGGTSVTLYGRVGDVPIYGCGLYAGPAGAVALTGEGEEIIKRAMARSIYEQMAKGVAARKAIDEAVRAFPAKFDLGVIAVDKKGWGVAANRPMAYGMGAK